MSEREEASGDFLAGVQFPQVRFAGGIVEDEVLLVSNVSTLRAPIGIFASTHNLRRERN
jgi:hypothetical protein